MNPQRNNFLEFCSEITGYSCFDLEGTTLVDTYQSLIEGILGPKQSEFYDLIDSIVKTPESEIRQEKLAATLEPLCVFAPVISELISLWYLGAWTRLPNAWYEGMKLPIPGSGDAGRTQVPSAAAYVEQLSYRTAGAHPPGAKPTGFGSWSFPPISEAVNRE